MDNEFVVSLEGWREGGEGRGEGGEGRGGGGEGRGGEGRGGEGRGGREGGREEGEGGKGGMTVIHIILMAAQYLYNNDVTYYEIT